MESHLVQNNMWMAEREEVMESADGTYSDRYSGSLWPLLLFVPALGRCVCAGVCFARVCVGLAFLI